MSKKLVKKANYDSKITDIEAKYFTRFDHKKITCEVLDKKIKKFGNKSDISGFIDKIKKNSNIYNQIIIKCRAR